ncbi:MAG: M23 family metallopeptidase [Clostridia bacterium]|nr:M23 family metallopeptidase [Clostridia bacterium]
MQENNFFKRLKDDKGVQAITITVVAMFLVLTAIIITTVVANRATVENPDDLPAGVEDPDDEGNTPGGDQPGEEQQPPADTLPSQFLLPVSGVLLSEHDATVQVFSPTMKDYRIHLGIDIATVAGASVSAMADGVVSQVWEDVRMGHCVAIKHGGDAYTIYKNLSGESAPTVGATVKAGDVIGTVGESAMVEIAEEPHLHVEMTVGGLQVDPTDYLSEDAMATLREDTNYEDAS